MLVPLVVLPCWYRILIVAMSCCAVLCCACVPQLLRYTRWGGALVDASTAANYGFSPTEWARGTTDYRNSDREAILEDARMCDFMGPHPHGYR
jgi:hypothetical protein